MGSALGFLPSTIRSCGDTGRPRRTSSGCRPFQARSRSFCLAMPRCDLWSDHEVTAPRQPARRREPRGASSRRPLLREPLGNARGRPILAPALTRSVALPPATPSRGPGCGRWRRRSSGRMCGRLESNAAAIRSTRWRAWRMATHAASRRPRAAVASARVR